MNYAEMIASLAPANKKVDFKGFSFFCRPMTVQEFIAHCSSYGDPQREEKAILACVVDADGKPVFKSLDDVLRLPTTLRSLLANGIGEMTMVEDDELPEFEESVK